MNIQRVKYADHGLNKSFQRLKKILKTVRNQNHKDCLKEDILVSLGETLLWINILNDLYYCSYKECYEGLAESYNQDVAGQICGMKYAFNLIKHEIDLIELHEEENIYSAAILGVSTKITRIKWKNLSQLPSHNKKPAYIKFLEGKLIKTTIKEVIDFLKIVKKELLY